MLKEFKGTTKLERLNIFCVRQKNRRKTQPTFQAAIFQNKFTLFYIRLNIYIWKTMFSSPKQHLFGLPFFRIAKKTHIEQIILETFVLCLKWSISQTFKSNRCKKVFPGCVYHWYNLLGWMFFIPCDDWKTFYLRKSIFIQRFGKTAMLLSFL